MPPKARKLACQRRFIDRFLVAEFLSDTLANQFGYRFSLLAAHRGKDLGDLLVEVKLRALHNDVYYTSLHVGLMRQSGLAG